MFFPTAASSCVVGHFLAPDNLDLIVLPPSGKVDTALAGLSFLKGLLLVLILAICRVLPYLEAGWCSCLVFVE